MNRIAIISLVVICLGLAGTAHGGGFFELIYAGTVSQEKDLVGSETVALKDASGYGVMFGYDTEIMGSGVFFDVELGYEVSTHEIDAPFADSDYFYRNHRGLMGIRLKYGGLGYVEPYIAAGVMIYAYFEASDVAAADTTNYAQGAPDFEIEKNLSGSYIAYGVDFFFSVESSFSLGIEQRVFTFSGLDSIDKASEADAEVSRLSFKISVLF